MKSVENDGDEISLFEISLFKHSFWVSPVDSFEIDDMINFCKHVEANLRKTNDNSIVSEI